MPHTSSARLDAVLCLAARATPAKAVALFWVYREFVERYAMPHCSSARLRRASS